MVAHSPDITRPRISPEGLHARIFLLICHKERYLEYIHFRYCLQFFRDHEHIYDDWAEISWAEDCLYCRDELENTMISVFNRVDGELICYVGCLRPAVSVGGPTGVYVISPWDVIDYLSDNLEDMYLDLAKKCLNLNKESE